ncbi:hypothetical protein KIN20_013390 [Parelaphostrongylus tenuis]|uniref:Uncharacterized protein n=1 Tax=Parelaphostrongylus tenuis TaxID=148309 RepID=A0AAD5MDH8_PARTN|nr:hypothetical protein KIN20_013390 [Parelaphostrongylus tenuis]
MLINQRPENHGGARPPRRVSQPTRPRHPKKKLFIANVEAKGLPVFTDNICVFRAMD